MPNDPEQEQDPIMINFNGIEMTVIHGAGAEGQPDQQQQIIIDTSNLVHMEGEGLVQMVVPTVVTKEAQQASAMKTTKKKKKKEVEES